MIRANDAGGVHDYSVAVTKFSLPEDKKLWGMHVLNPVNNRFEGVNVVDVYLPNLYKLKIKVDRRPFNRTLAHMSLGSGDEVMIMDMGDYRKSKEFSIMHAAIMNDKSKE